MNTISEEIKAKIIIEADTSGAEEAAAALEKLQGISGGAADGAGAVTDAASAMNDQFAESAKGAEALNEALGNGEEALASNEEAVSNLNDTLGEHQQAVENVGSAYEDFQGQVGDTTEQLKEVPSSIDAVTKSTQVMSEQMAKTSDSIATFSQALSPDTLEENMRVFQDLANTPQPMMMLQSYLQETSQGMESFVQSIGKSYADVHDQVTQAATGIVDTQTAMDNFAQADPWAEMATSATEANTVVQDAGTVTEDTLYRDAYAIQATSGNFAALGASTEQASKNFDVLNDAAGNVNQALSQTNDAINQFGGVGSSQYGPLTLADTLTQHWGLAGDEAQKAMAQMGLTEESSGLGGILGSAFADLGNFGMGFDAIMRPIMMLQMGGQIVGQIATGIYDAAAVAEGPGAHGIGTFTGTVDALGQSIQATSQTFSEGFGQNLLPTLNALNYQMNQGSGSNIGGVLGSTASFLSNIGLITAGLIAGPFGGGLIDAGAEGLVNMGAQAIGVPQPFQGPGPVAQAQINYQQQMGQLPQTVTASAYQTQLSANTLIQEGLDPNYLQQQDNLGAAQQFYQKQQASYNASHPISPQQAALNYQYGQQDAADQQAYQQYLASGGTPITPDNPYGTGGGGGGIGGFFSSIWNGTARALGLEPIPSDGGPMTSVAQSQGWPNLGSIFSGLSGLSSPGGFANFGADLANIGKSIGSFLGLGGGGDQAFTPTGGCFVAGTPILLPNGTTKPIETLRKGEQVLGYDGKKQHTLTILACMAFPAKQTYKLTFSDDRTLITSDSHPIATTQGWKSLSPNETAKENPGLEVSVLEVGDTILTMDGTHTLVAIEAQQIERVYNFTVDGSHTYYANGILVHNIKGAMTAGSMSTGGTGTESVSLSHTFTANVTWEANNLEKQFTAAAQWAGQNLTHAVVAAAQWTEHNIEHAVTAAAQWTEQNVTKAVTAAAQWTEQNVIKPVVAAAEWTEQNVTHAVVAAAEWTEQNVQHAVTAMAQWTEQNVVHPVVAAAEWAEKNLEHTAVAVASWGEKNLEHLFEGEAQWVGQNLTHTFFATAQWVMGGGGGAPAYAEGTSYHPGGAAMIAEAGSPEVVEHNGMFSLFDSPAFVNLPAGSAVYPLQEMGGPSPRMFASGTGDTTPVPLMIGGNSGMQTANISIHLDSTTLMSALGVALSQNIRIGMGLRSF